MDELFGGWETSAPSANCSQGQPPFSPPPPEDIFGLSSMEEEQGWPDSSFGSFARWFEDLDEPVALPPQSKGVPLLSPASETDMAALMESGDGASSVSACSLRSSVDDLLEELMLERETLENARPPTVEYPPASLVPPSPSLLQLNSFVGRVPAIGSGLHFLTARGRGRRASGAAAGAKRKQRKEGRDKQKKGKRGKHRSMEGKRGKSVNKKKRRVEERSM